MRIAHTMIRVADLDESIDFYTNKIGLELVSRDELPGADATLAFIRDPKSGHEIELTYNHDGRDYDLGDAFGHIAFYVADVDATIAQWRERGVPVALEPLVIGNGMKIAFVTDPTGYALELIEKPEAA
ncbi:lactoylglutathione lyase [Thiohalospira halophila DSM 15071]|uniref:Aldoketomutase n=1 Tax=Thiohalospira halophila DSM 15071 TaxID=1123397 RepID=A0A1I1Q094_9GAMM|nr:VOC family protein [Thiohalospira halophila]SFD15342.1 lactoylglutathione lyase [Thiohalospira halophila DSM 15071]